MLNPNFNKSIRKIIEILMYPMYVVELEDKLCTCLDHNDTPDSGCKKCLGTGKKITIREILGVLEPDDVSIRLEGTQDKVASNYYYFDTNLVPLSSIKPKNLIVRGDEVDILQTAKHYRSDSNDTIYYYIEGVPLKSYKNIFLKNFRELIK